MSFFQTQVQLTRFDFDTETFLMSPGCHAPPVVCAQARVNRGPATLRHAAKDADVLLDTGFRHGIVSGHNLPYDLACICATWPDLEEVVWDCLEQSRAVCTQQAIQLWDISRGCLQKDGYDLASVLERLAPESGLHLDKSDPWRQRYGTLYPVPLEDWPADAKAYALKDAEAQCLVMDGIIFLETQMPGVFEDVFRKTRTAFWHHLIACWGQRTSRPRVDAFRERVLRDWERDRAVCLEAGLVRRDGTKDTKAAQAAMARAWLAKAAGLGKTAQEAQESLPRTDAGAISLSEDTCTQLGDPLLLAYQRFGSLSTSLKRLDKLYAGTVVPMQPRFRLPLETGRSSCSEGNGKKGKPDPHPMAYGFQMQNPPAGCNTCGGEGEVQEHGATVPCPSCDGGAVGVRQCFVARPGYVLCSVDYDGFELKTWAQVCIWAVGRSRLADVLNSKIEVNGKMVPRDPHTELAATLAGMTALEAYQLRAKKDKHADAWDLKFRQSAKPANFGFPGGMGAERFVDAARMLYGVTVTLEEAIKLRAAWLETWPEAREYFKWASSIEDGDPIVSFTPPGEPGGLIRGGTSYTQRCNHPFQNLASSAAGAAGWVLARECYLRRGGPGGRMSPLYGSRPWGFLHDEFIMEIPERNAHEAAERQAEVQRSVAQKWIPDITVTASPALMRGWHKKAKTVYQNGRLIPWEDAA